MFDFVTIKMLRFIRHAGISTRYSQLVLRQSFAIRYASSKLDLSLVRNNNDLNIEKSKTKLRHRFDFFGEDTELWRSVSSGFEIKDATFESHCDKHNAVILKPQKTPPLTIKSNERKSIDTLKEEKKEAKGTKSSKKAKQAIATKLKKQETKPVTEHGKVTGKTKKTKDRTNTERSVSQNSPSEVQHLADSGITAHQNVSDPNSYEFKESGWPKTFETLTKAKIKTKTKKDSKNTETSEQPVNEKSLFEVQLLQDASNTAYQNVSDPNSYEFKESGWPKTFETLTKAKIKSSEQPVNEKSPFEVQHLEDASNTAHLNVSDPNSYVFEGTAWPITSKTLTEAKGKAKKKKGSAYLETTKQTVSQNFPNEVHHLKESDNTVNHQKDSDPNSYVFKATGWTDTFGTLSEAHERPLDHVSTAALEGSEEPEEQGKPHKRLKTKGRGRVHEPEYYAKKVADFDRSGKVFEALQLVETEMLAERRVLPSRHTFLLLLGMLAKRGYHEKALQIHRQMRQLDKDCGAAYTCSFTALANSPKKEEALRDAHRLYQQWQRNTNISHHAYTFGAMIKAFGRLGDLEMAFHVADEYDRKKVNKDNDERVLVSLLNACIADRKSGLKLAIELWRGVRKRRQPFCLEYYQLLLRCIRDCGLGEPQHALELIPAKYRPDITQLQQFKKTGSLSLLTADKDGDKYLGEWVDDHNASETAVDNTSSELSSENVQTISLTQRTSSDNNTDSPECDTQLVKSDHTHQTHKYWWEYDVSDVTEDTPDLSQATSAVAILTDDASVNVDNILNYRGRYMDAHALLNADTPEKRMTIFGGISGFLSHMRKDRIDADIKTFSLMLDVIPDNIESELLLLKYMDAAKVQPDVAFLNLLMKRRNKRRDFRNAREVLGLMGLHGLSPNTMTFGVLALGCLNSFHGKKLLKDMKTAGYVPNNIIYHTLVGQALIDDWAYLKHLLVSMRGDKLPPGEPMLRPIETRLEKAKKLILKGERGDEEAAAQATDKFRKQYTTFKLFYGRWLRSVEAEQPEGHWDKFQRPTQPEIDDYEDETRDVRRFKEQMAKKYKTKKVLAEETGVKTLQAVNQSTKTRQERYLAKLKRKLQKKKKKENKR